MRRETRLLAAALAALALAAAQEPEPVVVKIVDNGILDVFLSPDGRQVLARRSGEGTDFGSLYLVNVAEKRNESLCFFDGATKPPFIDCTPDWTVGARATYASGGGQDNGTSSVHLVNPTTMQTVRTIAKFQAGVHGGCLKISPDGKYLAYGISTPLGLNKGGQPGSIRIFDTTSGKELLLISTNIDGVQRLDISPDGKYLAGIILEKQVVSLRVWEVATANLLGKLEGHTGDPTRVRFSPDGQWLASVARDGTAILWNPAKGFAKAATFKKGPDALVGMAFSPDGSLLAVAGKQGVVTVWNIKTKKPTFTFHHPKPKPSEKAGNQYIYCLSFDNGGKYLAAGTADGNILIWPIAAATATGEGTKTEDK